MNALKANKFRVGDEVTFINYAGNGWEKDFGLYIGDVVQIRSIYKDNIEVFVSKTGKFVWCRTEQLSSSSAESFKETIESQPIQSDGGSSDYYFTKLPLHVIDQIILTGGIEIKDIARYVYDNDADAFNIIKAQKRIIEANKGAGKAGITKLYDANKIVYFSNEQYEAIKREGTNG